MAPGGHRATDGARVSDFVRRHYNYAEHSPEHRIMMEAWADYMDGLRSAQDQCPACVDSVTTKVT